MLKIWTNHSFTESDRAEFRARLGGHELFDFPPAENGAGGAAAAALKEADVAFGTPDADAVLNAGNVRWLQVNLAGYTPYDRADFRENFRRSGRAMTNSSSVYVEPCAQHALAMMLALARRLPQSVENQRGPKDWDYDETRAASYLLNGQTALIVGLGTIGRRLAELLAPFGMDVRGFRRTVRGDEPVAAHPIGELDAHLAAADHVVNILPANDATPRFFDAARIARFKAGARFYNIGRGSTVDQDALLAALRGGRLAAAYLDVTDPEPLPPDHPLWTAPNCFVTPHSAGGFADEKRRHVAHFFDNLRRFETGAQMRDRIY